MKIAIVGSRSYTEYEEFDERLAEILSDLMDEKPTIISGGAIGVDSMAKRFAKKFGLDFVEFNPYFKLDKSAQFTPKHFFIRNKQIVYNADIV